MKKNLHDQCTMLGSNSRRWTVSEEVSISKNHFKNSLSSYGSRLGKVAVILIFLISALNLSAQVTIGTGTTGSWPINRYYNYSASEHIYLKSEINQAGNICQFALSKASGDVSIPVSSVSIYFKHVGAGTTTLGTATTTTAGYTLVYSGAFPNNMASGWATVTLSTPFAYNNVDNLQILIVCGYEAYTYLYPTYNSTAQAVRRSRYWAADGAAFVNNSTFLTRSFNRPNAQFNLSCAAPSCVGSPTAPAIAATGVSNNPTLSWAAVSGATGYDVYFGTSNPATTLVSTNQAGTTYTPSALNPNTTYYWRIVPRNSTGLATGCSTWSFTTSAPCVPSGNPAVYGAGSWIGYVYNSTTAGAFTTYQGFVTEATVFNRTHSSASGATINHCSANQDLFTIRYRNTTNFPAGYYTFTVGGDDGVRFSIDGGATWLINQWVDQGYTTVNSAAVYLTGNVNMVFEYYENGSGSQSSFNYTFVPDPCSSATTMACGTSYSATLGTTGIWNVYTGCGYNDGGAEKVYVFTPTISGTHTFSATTTAGDPDFFIMSTCGTSGTNILGGCWDNGNVNANLTAGTTYYIIADNYLTTANSSFNLSVTCPTPPAWQSQWISMNTGAANWCAGETRNITVTVKNTGTNTWTNATPDINIGVKWNADADYFVRADANGLVSGATQTFTFSVTAPSTPGYNNLSFDVVNEGNFWFANNAAGVGPGNVVYVSTPIAISSVPTVNAGTDALLCPGTNLQLAGSASNAIVPAMIAGSQTFNWNGYGYDGGVAGYLYGYIEGTTSGMPAGSVISSVTYSTNVDYGSPGGTGYCGNWYGAELYSNGNFVAGACDVSNITFAGLNGQSANNQLFRLWLYDLDDYDDYEYMELSVTINYSYPSTQAGTISYLWSPSAGLSNATISNPAANPVSTTTYTLTATNNGCSTSDAVIVTVGNLTLAAAPTNGDMVWRGAATSDWTTLGNWWQINGTSYGAATAAPTAAQNVIIPANQTCVLNQPNTFANGGNAKTLRIESGANLTMGNGTLSIAENMVNNGTFAPGTGTVEFTGSGTHTISGSSLAHNFNNITMNKAGEVQLSVPIAMSGALTLTNGRLDIGNSNLDLPTNTINGGNASSYVKTSGTGTLSRDVAGIAVNFPVGRSAYNAATLTNTGTADKYSIRVIDNVTDIGTNADAGATTTMAVVNRTWMISEQDAGGSDVTLGLNWNGAPEHIGGFQEAGAFIAHYMSGAGLWDNIGGAVSTDLIVTSGITSFSPFTISSDLNFAPLPVELMSFSSVCLDNDVAIKWTTASENNSMHFVVETSTDGVNWEVLSVVPAAQFSSSILNYAITHEGAARNKNYYRLKQVDLDGAVEFYNVIYANCGNVAGEPVAFPNPSNGNFTIDFSGAEMKGVVQLSIMNAEGKEISTREFNLEEGVNTYQINNMELQPGIYYLKIVDTTGRSFIIKHSFI